MSKDNSGQLSLFNNLDDFTAWKQEWKGMPEYSQEDLMPWKTVYVHFEEQADLDKFSELVKQNILPTTKYMWFPKVGAKQNSKYRWIDDIR